MKNGLSPNCSLSITNTDGSANSNIDRNIHTIPESRFSTRSLLGEEEKIDFDGDFARSASGASGNIEKVFRRGNYIGTVNHSGKPNGRGVMRFNDGSVYDGEWHNSVIVGVGICTFSDGLTEYNGEWKKGKPDGQGYFIYSNGDRYDGSWANGQMDGRGFYAFQNSERYDGGWKQNKSHGYGRYVYRDGNIYEGLWRHGKRQGNGIFKYANGDEFAGEYSDDKKDGLGVFRRANGEVDIMVYNDYLHGEGVRFSSDRKKAWNVERDGSCKMTSMGNAETFRENATIISVFLAHYLDKYI